MSICLDTSTVLATAVGAVQKAELGTGSEKEDPSNNKNVAKFIVNNTQASTQPVKVVNSSVITVVNTPGPIVVKSLCPSSGSPFTLINSNVKLVNGPAITVLKNISSENNKMPENGNAVTTNTNSNSSIAEKSLHSVFLKKSENAIGGNQEIPQSHKILTANTFPQNNIVQNINPSLPLKTANGQRSIAGNKLKIISNVVMQSNVAGPSNILLNKTINQRYYQQSKIVGNGATKYLNKAGANNIKNTPLPQKTTLMDKPSPRNVYPTHKSQMKTLSPINNYINKPGIKTLSPQVKSLPAHVQRTGIGLKTIPPQKPPKFGNKPNYIGKHAIQAQKIRTSVPKLKTIKTAASFSGPYANKAAQNTQMTVSQALTAEILESLGHDSSKVAYESVSNRYDVNYSDSRSDWCSTQRSDYKPQSNLDTLSFVCQAVLLDHNYNATLPSEAPSTPPTTTSQINGSVGNLYSPGSGKRRPPIPLLSSAATNLSSALMPNSNNNNNTVLAPDDDNASDISCGSDHKDSEGEETDTAPEAEAVCNEDQNDRYGDTVTRCICGFIHDDGYMIECDKCKVWQHVRCVVRNRKVPDDYLCEECDPTKPTDRQKAKLLQQQWMREVQANFRKEQQLKEALSDSDSSDFAEPANNNNFILKSRRKSEPTKMSRQRNKEVAKDTNARRPLKRKEKKTAKRKQKTQNKSHSDEEKKEPLPQLRQWIENYEEAVTNHYSPELRARISNIRINGAHSEFTGQIDPSVHKCKVQALENGVKCLVSTASLAPGVPVIELRGKYMLSVQHRTAYSGNLTTRQQRPGPFLFFYQMQKDNTEVCVDTRTYGNIARFVRRSCQPNAELKHCIEKGVLHLYVVAMAMVEKNVELTIKHESHDMAVVGAAEIACACGDPEQCAVNKIKKNGDLAEINRKRRGRRTVSVSEPVAVTPVVKPKEEPAETDTKEEKKEEIIAPSEPIKQEIKEEVVELKIEDEEVELAVAASPVKTECKVKKEEKERSVSPPPPPPPPPPGPLSTRRSSHHKNEEEKVVQPIADNEKNKKLSREDRKLQAIMKAIERMERLEQRKQEHQAKQAQRRESEPAIKDDDRYGSKLKRRKRKGRARTVSTSQRRRNRLDSADSIHATSSDDTLLSPSDNVEQNSPSKAAGLLLALANGENQSKSPERIGRDRDLDSNSNSSPETPLSSACLLVAAAVEPLEPGFKFPKTKKGLMNEWLNKGTDIQPASSISPSSLTPHFTQPTDSALYEVTGAGLYPSKNLSALAQVASFCESPLSLPSKGNAKKRWLRQAISEDQCDSPCTRPESPQSTEPVAAPPKKRKLPRESISADSPPTTPTSTGPPTSLKDTQEVDVTSGESESPKPQEFGGEGVEAAEEFRSCSTPVPTAAAADVTPPPVPAAETPRKGCLLDPRLSRDRLTTDQLVGTVEKTLSILGYGGEKRPALITPAKRKLSITEYRQRKRLNHNEKTADENAIEESPSSSQSPKHSRNRSNSSSSNTSPVSSDDETLPTEVPEKSLSAFNSEPTELERERENLSSRLKKTFGLSVDEDYRKTTINMETLLKCDLSTPVKTTLPLSSPTFPIPGSTEPSSSITLKNEETVSSPPASILSPHASALEQKEQPEQGASVTSKDPVMYYTPDEEESEATDDGKFNKIESTSYVPPFNNPLYPNNVSYTSYGSVIDDDAPYEGRNPSPPPELGNV